MKPVIYPMIFAAALLALPLRSEIQPIGPGLFVAGVNSAEFEFFAARQNKPNWCWAACVQMVLNFHGLYVRQEDVVARIFGGQVDAPGQPSQILAALSGWAPDRSGRFSTIHASPYVMRGSDIVRDLAYKWPIIVGLRQPGAIGHAYVLTAVTYAVDPYTNEPIFRSVVLRDPWPANPSRIELSWQEFQGRTMFMARVYVQRH